MPPENSPHPQPARDSWRGALENSIDAMIGIDRDQRITDWNRQAEALFGFGRDDILGARFAEALVSEESRASTSSYFARFFQGSETSKRDRRLEVHAVRKDGQPVTVELCAISLPAGEQPCLYFFASEMAAPKSRAAAKGLSDDRFRVHFEQAAISIQLLSPDGHTLAVNNAWRALWGIPDEFIRDYILQGYNLLKDQQLTAKGIMPFIEKGFAGEASEIPPILYDPAELGSGGKRRWVSGFIYPVKDEAGTVTEVVLTHQDVTAAREALLARDVEQKKFESLFEESPAIMALVRGPEFIFEKTNTAYQQLIGHREVIGKPLREALPELMDSPFPPILRRVFETGEPYYVKESRDHHHRVPGAPPEEVFLDFTYQRVNGPTGEPYGIIGTAIDVTEQVRSRQRVENLAAELQDAVRARDEFISICSHELKTPITSMKLQFQMAAKQLERDDPRVFSRESIEKRTNTANHQLARMAHLIEDMLDVSRISAGKLQVNRERLDLYEVLHEVVERFGEQFASLGMPMHFEGRANEARVEGDRYRLEQVISNLFTNALKYGAAKPVDVTLTSSAGTVRMSVTDRGIGIAPENLDRVFGRFERAVSASNISGLGLGLYISRNIIEAHGGRIWVESELGKGSTFFVELPSIPVSGKEL